MSVRKKLRSKGGFTLSELLTAVAILGLIVAALGVGLPTAVRAYRQVTAVAEAQVLCSTLSTAITDELHYATEPKETGGGVTFDSAVHGRGVSLSAQENEKGQTVVTIGGKPLLGSGVYTSGLHAAVGVTYSGGLFSVALTITDADGHIWAQSSLTIAPLNVP